MVAVQIRDVPDDVRDTLVRVADAEGKSLQSYLLTMLTQAARRADRLALLDQLAAQGGGSHMTAEEGLAVLDEARRERDERLIGLSSVEFTG